ncbi:nicotinamide n-methyltransferase [Phlyctochytrium planicorne]|nr:nicotinamide n-methyltransferase [Phlyctochytrium planicorne]
MKVPSDFLGTPKQLELNLIGKHSLWGHRLWNAGVVMARKLDREKSLCKGKCVLELGAAAATPSLICAMNDAALVSSTDWPDPELINNIWKNARVNVPDKVENGGFQVIGYQWGQDVSPILAVLPEGKKKYDLVLLADLIFNHTEHMNLLKTCKETVEPGTGSIIVSFTHHVVKWSDRDDKFFELAAQDPFNFNFEKVEEVKASAMFPDDVDCGYPDVK